MFKFIAARYPTLFVFLTYKLLLYCNYLLTLKDRLSFESPNDWNSGHHRGDVVKNGRLNKYIFFNNVSLLIWHVELKLTSVTLNKM